MSARESGIQPARRALAGPGRIQMRGPAADLRCGSCGYGIATGAAPEACPMCRTATWEPALWQPFSRLGAGVPLRR